MNKSSSQTATVVESGGGFNLTSRADLSSVTASAIACGLDFLSRRIGDDGAWHSRFYRNLQLSGEWTSEYPPFITALGMLSLQSLRENSAAQKLHARSREFLLARAESPGVWRYSDRLPPDLDDTALCTLAVGAHPWALFSDRHIQIALTCRNSHGRFRTWILPRRIYRQSLPAAHHTDSVVNANALAWLGVRAQTEAAARWLTELVESGDEKNSSYYYPEVVDLHIAMARAAAINAPLFADLRATLIARLREWLARESDDIARVAQTLSALHMLGVNFGGGDEFDAAIRRVLDAQRDDGSWRENLLWRGSGAAGAAFVGLCIRSAEHGVLRGSVGACQCAAAEANVTCDAQKS